MSTKFQIKRSSVPGKKPTTSDLDAGELGLNMRDAKLFAANSSAVFEIGSNVTSTHVGTLKIGNTSPYTLPTSDGTADYYLKTDGSGTITFAPIVGSNTGVRRFLFTPTANQTIFATSAANSGAEAIYANTNAEVYLNGVKLVFSSDYTLPNTTHVVLSSNAIAADSVEMVTYEGTLGSAALIANSTTKYLEKANASIYLQVANATPSVDTTLTGNTSIQRLDIEDNAGTSVFSTTLRNGLFFGNNYFISSYDFEKNTTSTSKTIIASTRGEEVAVEFLVLVTDTTTTPPERQFSKILAIHDGTDAFISEYGQMYTGSGPLASFSATFQRTPDYIYLEANPTTSNRLKYKVTRMGMRD